MITVTYHKLVPDKHDAACSNSMTQRCGWLYLSQWVRLSRWAEVQGSYSAWAARLALDPVS